jgi:hypothetical protein
LVLVLSVLISPGFGGALAAEVDFDSPLDRPWIGPQGEDLPFETDTELMEFLRTAKVVSSQKVEGGTSKARKVLLEKNGIRLNAIFRNISIYKHKIVFEGGLTKYFFRDDARLEVAAYKLAKLLGISNVPPAVERKLFRTRGTVQLWVESAMTEKQRNEKDLFPEDIELWRLQIQVMRLFDNLLYNDDRNLGNILFDSDWKLWMVDHTRTFRRHKELPCPKTIVKVERSLWENLRDLDPQVLKETLKPYLLPAEMRGLLKRQELLIELVEDLIEKRGETLILFDFPGPAALRAGTNLQPSVSP